MRFVNRHALCCPVDFGGRGVQEADDTGRSTASLQDVESANDIRVHIGARCLIGVWNSDQAGEVKDIGAAFNGLRHARIVTHVTAKYLKLRADFGWNIGKPSDGAP